MTCSIPFIELTMVVDKDDFQKQLNRAYEKAMKKNHLMYETSFGHMDESLISKGIGITYHGDSKKRKIKFVVFPSIAIDDDSPELWETTDSNISKLLKKLEKLTDSYFNSEYKALKISHFPVLTSSPILMSAVKRKLPTTSKFYITSVVSSVSHR